jgi:hypothetical protein
MHMHLCVCVCVCNEILVFYKVTVLQIKTVVKMTSVDDFRNC